ncbi:hypothetical protein V8E36_005286 [Tilletia maclaganii]
MPLHRIYHTKAVFQDPAERQALAKAITDIYSGPNSRAQLPKFYVVVVFVPLEEGNLFVGGDVEEAREFVRFSVEHIAVQLPPKDKLSEGVFDVFMDRYHQAIKPFTLDKGYHYEVSHPP